MQLLTSLSGLFQSPVLARAAYKLLLTRTKFIFGKKRNSPFEGEKHFQQNPGAKYRSKRNCFVLAQKLLELICTVALQEEKQMWDLQLLIAPALLKKPLSFLLLVGIFFCSPNHC